MSGGATSDEVEIGVVIERAAAIIRRGGLVAIPTETVYGLAADATNDEAVHRIYAAKGRPIGHPLIVHLAAADDLTRWAASIPDAATSLAEACWPGPLTLIVPAADHVSRLVTGGRDTVGVRVPAHPMTQALLAALGPHAGLAAPSANRFGRVSPTSAAHVAADLGPAVDYVLDGGVCPVGVESTIVDTTVTPPQVLRPGGIAADDIARILGDDVADATGPSRAPGMLASHYAPAAPVVLVATLADAERIATEHRADTDTGTDPARRGDSPTAASRHVVIVHDDDTVRYARELYARLRDADRAGASLIVAVVPPAAGIGHAIRDRLAKAAAAQ